MTNAQKWVSIFLVLFVILLALSKLTSRNEDESYSNNIYNSNETEQKSKVEILISNNRCMNCHGANLDGSASGPSLTKVGQDWTKEELIKFLKDPSAFSADPRVQRHKGKYRMGMVPYDKLSDEQLSILADHLMSL